MPDHQISVDERLREQFAALPKPVQDAITSADVQQHLRSLAESQKLHLDQWQLLENEVMLTLLGFQDVDSLAHNIQTHVDLPAELAAQLAADISSHVFVPIREQLERELEHPDAKKAADSGVAAARGEALAAEVPPAVAPGTPPAATNETKVARAPISEAYKAGQSSSGRTSVHDDPYRESPV